MVRGCCIASVTACLVMALKTTRSITCLPSAFFSLRNSSTCQEIASPSRSGSVARMSLSAPLTALAISLRRFCALGSTSQSILKLWSGSTDPDLADMAKRGQDFVALAQILIDGLRLGGRFYEH